jgi:hypothetical protein
VACWRSRTPIIEEVSALWEWHAHRARMTLISPSDGGLLLFAIGLLSWITYKLEYGAAK